MSSRSRLPSRAAGRSGAVAVLAAVLFCACADPALPPAADGTPRIPGVAKDALFAVLKTDKGIIRARLFADEAPKTVANFIGLAEGSKDWRHPGTGNRMKRTRYYDGLTFHRVIPGFMIQTGDPLGTGDGGPGYTFPDEFHPKRRFDKPGMLGMANWGAGTNNGQFFITLAPKPELNDVHTVFGEVVEGMDVVREIAKVPRDTFDDADAPFKAVHLRSVEIERGR